MPGGRLLEQLAGGHPWAVVDHLLVCADGARADGGQVGNWGRAYPYGGVLDLTTLTWRALPDRPKAAQPRRPLPGLRLGDRVLTSDGLVLDPRTDDWDAVPEPILDRLARSGAATVWTGRALLVWGGVTWSDPRPTLHADGVALVPPVDTDDARPVVAPGPPAQKRIDGDNR